MVFFSVNALPSCGALLYHWTLKRAATNCFLNLLRLFSSVLLRHEHTLRTATSGHQTRHLTPSHIFFKERIINEQPLQPYSKQDLGATSKETEALGWKFTYSHRIFMPKNEGDLSDHEPTAEQKYPWKTESLSKSTFDGRNVTV